MLPDRQFNPSLLIRGLVLPQNRRARERHLCQTSTPSLARLPAHTSVTSYDIPRPARTCPLASARNTETRSRPDSRSNRRRQAPNPFHRSRQRRAQPAPLHRAPSEPTTNARRPTSAARRPSFPISSTISGKSFAYRYPPTSRFRPTISALRDHAHLPSHIVPVKRRRIIQRHAHQRRQRRLRRFLGSVPPAVPPTPMAPSAKGHLPPSTLPEMPPGSDAPSPPASPPPYSPMQSSSRPSSSSVVEKLVSSGLLRLLAKQTTASSSLRSGPSLRVLSVPG